MRRVSWVYSSWCFTHRVKKLTCSLSFLAVKVPSTFVDIPNSMLYWQVTFFALPMQSLFDLYISQAPPCHWLDVVLTAFDCIHFSAVYSVWCVVYCNTIILSITSCWVVVADGRCSEESCHAAGVDAWPGGWWILPCIFVCSFLHFVCILYLCPVRQCYEAMTILIISSTECL